MFKNSALNDETELVPCIIEHIFKKFQNFTAVNCYSLWHLAQFWQPNMSRNRLKI